MKLSYETRERACDGYRAYKLKFDQREEIVFNDVAISTTESRLTLYARDGDVLTVNLTEEAVGTLWKIMKNLGG